MADPFIAEIRVFPFNFPPRGWAWCDGQILPLAQNTALFSLLGTTYGGNGQSNFALPNLQGRAALGFGQGPGLSVRDLGESGGQETVTLLESQIPFHNHALTASPDDADGNEPAGRLLSKSAKASYANAFPTAAMAAGSVAATGGSQPHNNMQPYLTLYFCIALQGVFPPRF